MMLMRSLLFALLVSPSAHSFQVSTSTSANAKRVALKSHSDDQTDGGRRTFMATGVTAAASLMLPKLPAYADGGVDYKAVAKDIMKLVEKNPDWGPSEYSCS